MKERNTINFLGVQVDVLDTNGLRERVLELAAGQRQTKVMYVNADCMLLSLKNEDYRQVLNSADLVYADGVGVVWGARLWSYRLPGRSTGADFMLEFCKEFARRGLSVFLLGAKEGIAEEAAERLIKKIPDLNIKGTQHGFFKKEEEGAVINKINELKPDILLVGLGAPYQEKWIDVNAKKLEVPVIWGVGGLFDFVSDRTWRGPQYLLDHGFEWLCRLLTEPRRLSYRYVIGNTKFLFYLLKYKFIKQKDIQN